MLCIWIQSAFPKGCRVDKSKSKYFNYDQSGYMNKDYPMLAIELVCDAFILVISSYGLYLGMDWLKKHIVIFGYKGQMVKMRDSSGRGCYMPK